MMTGISAGFVVAAATSIGLVTSAQAMTLADAVARAYETNPGLQAQRAALRALDESYVQARSGYGLQVVGDLTETQYHLRNGAAIADTTTDSETLSLVQPLYTGGRVRHRVSAAEAQIDAGRQNLRGFELDLLNRVITAYVNVRRDEQILQINRDTIQVLERQLSDTQAKFTVRQLTATDVAQSKARLAQARSTLATADAQLQTSRFQFLSIVGVQPIDLKEPPELEVSAPTIELAFERAEIGNPQLLAAVSTEQSSRALVHEAEAGKLPTVTARLDIQRAPYVVFQPSTGINNTRAATVTLSQPIFSSGQISSAIRQAKQTNSRDQLLIEDVRRQVIQQVSSAWESLVATRKQVATFDEEVRADEFAFYGVRTEEKFALRSTIEVLNAELELTNAQQNLVRVRAQEYSSRSTLLAATGELDVASIASTVRRYDPQKNFNTVKNLGATPLELPVRIFDKVLTPGTKAQPPALLDGVPVAGSDLPPEPPKPTPIVSILSALNQEPTPPTDIRSAPQVRPAR